MSILQSSLRQFRYYKSLADKAIAQVSDDSLFWQASPESNSIAILVQHLAGNMLSRWTDFLETDGEKPWRNRDAEFEQQLNTRTALLEYWEKGWHCLFDALSPLAEADLQRIVYIRNEGHTVEEAILRQLCHYPYHVGQIVFLAKMAVETGHWQTLSIARNHSSVYNDNKFSEDKGIRHFTNGV